ncbi:MAG TPA: XRE family transcriptional regulator [Smithellaceae bacterium]|mgnify:FL=1|nr:XRE family transcriptional regulator [Smithellaceae bacterium]HRS82863.1 XRE family transcriptional regulator [Smithellaceae bacterium]HRV45377.1 XRE family transcriptional regulator [Smithellaceae bacterium]
MKQQSTINEADIGRRIKSLRNEKRVTLEELAAQTGFTKGYLSKVEKSEKAPPVSTLGIIARALSVNISTLLGEDTTTSSICLVKKSERSQIRRTGTSVGYSYEAVAHKFKNKLMEPFVLTLPVHAKRRVLYQHEGQEILFVLEGTMRFHHGAEEIIAEEGDCVYFDSGIPHFGESVGDNAVKCFMVIFNSGVS